MANPATVAQLQTALEQLMTQFNDYKALHPAPAQNQANPPLNAVIIDPELAQQVKEIKAILSHTQGGTVLDFDGLCIFPEAQLPEKFKMPDIEKFDGTGNPTSHVRLVVNTLKPMGLSDELIAQLFQRTLKGSALNWFLTLDFPKYKGWQEIAKAFIQQYDYNVQIEVTTRDLEMIKQEPNESFAKFLTRWREKAALVKTRPSEEDQVRIVIRNLQPQLLRYLYPQAISTFKHLYAVGIQVEDGLNQGLLEMTETSHKMKTSTYPSNNSGINTVRTHVNHKRKREFVPLGMSLEDVFHILEAKGELKQLQPKFSSGPAQKSGEYCKYHQVYGHPIEECGALKNAVQDLIDQGKVDPAEWSD